MGIKITIPNTSSDTLTFGSANTTTAAQIAGIDSGSSNGQLALYTTASGTSTERVRINASGNVGIGTASPSALLHLSANAPVIKLYNSSSNDTPYIQGGTAGAGGDGYLYLSGGSGRGVKLAYNAGTVGATLDNSGNVGIGVASPLGRLGVKGSGTYASAYNSNEFQIFDPSGTDTAGYGFYINQTYAASTVAATITLGVNNSNNHTYTLVVRNNTQGVQLTAGATSWTSASDERLKTNLSPITNAASKVASLRPVTGRYISDDEGTSRAFVIAQEVLQVLPEAVTEIEQDGEKYLGLQYTDLIPLLTAAIQEQQAIITSLTDRITALENK